MKWWIDFTVSPSFLWNHNIQAREHIINLISLITQYSSASCIHYCGQFINHWINQSAISPFITLSCNQCSNQWASKLIIQLVRHLPISSQCLTLFVIHIDRQRSLDSNQGGLAGAKKSGHFSCWGPSDRSYIMFEC